MGVIGEAAAGLGAGSDIAAAAELAAGGEDLFVLSAGLEFGGAAAGGVTELAAGAGGIAGAVCGGEVAA